MSGVGFQRRQLPLLAVEAAPDVGPRALKLRVGQTGKSEQLVG
jgi:hypothetical protein